ncbi:hypothetical protein [Sphingomonas sp. NIBR02145]|uniref:hypothetical protein n=1 Tax=Sphingomonas sp. NIBR02145 TaxID=3014784 RepID=UPI0022B5E4DB|nr:hypothetical protein [Sphingomonas sp. NIBR02145]WHU02499.1 hypothetical protein O3305_20340 [Sphingomonas sp. NIBR02145]
MRFCNDAVLITLFTPGVRRSIAAKRQERRVNAVVEAALRPCIAIEIADLFADRPEAVEAPLSDG